MEGLLNPFIKYAPELEFVTSIVVELGICMPSLTSILQSCDVTSETGELEDPKLIIRRTGSLTGWLKLNVLVPLHHPDRKSSAFGLFTTVGAVPLGAVENKFPAPESVIRPAEPGVMYSSE